MPNSCGCITVYEKENPNTRAYDYLLQWVEDAVLEPIHIVHYVTSVSSVCCILTFYNFLGLLEQSWDSCEKHTKELESRLRELKDEVKDPLPVEHEELYKSKEHIKVLTEHIVFVWM